MNRSPAGRKAQPRLQALGSVKKTQDDAGQQQQQGRAEKKSKRRELDPRLVKLFNEVRSEVGRIDAELPGGGSGVAIQELQNGATPADLNSPMQQVLGQLRGVRGRLGAVFVDGAPRPGTPPQAAKQKADAAELQALMTKMASLEQENAKIRRYATRAKAEIGKLQAERRRTAGELATSEFKLKEALAGRGAEANNMLEAAAKNEKTEKMKEWEAKHGTTSAKVDDEAELRQRHAEASSGGGGNPLAPNGGLVQCDQ